MLEHLQESAPPPEVLNVPLETFLPMKKANAEQILEAASLLGQYGIQVNQNQIAQLQAAPR